MDAYMVRDNFVQGDVRVSKVVRRAVAHSRTGKILSFIRFTSLVTLLIPSYYLCNVGFVESVDQGGSELSETSGNLRTLGRRDAVKKSSAVSGDELQSITEACPVGKCSKFGHHASSSKDASTQTFPPSETAPEVTTRFPSTTFTATSDKPLQTDTRKTEQSDRSTLEKTALKTLPTAPPHTGFSSATRRVTPSSAGSTARSGDEYKNKVKSIDDDDDDDDTQADGTQAAPEWFLKAAGGGRGMRNVEKFFNNWLRNRFGKRYDPCTCKKLRREGRQPSAALRHSPIDTFGYPVFDERSGRTFLERRLPLSIVHGYLVPIRVGAEDYVIQGTYDQISAFLECFEEYQIIASRLQPDGHWSADTDHGALFLQVQNTVQNLESPFDNSKILFRWGFERIIRMVAGARSIKNLSETNSYDELMDLFDSIEHIADYLPYITKEELLDFWHELVQLPSIPDRLRLLCAFLERSFSRSRSAKKSRWTDDSAVNLRSPLTLTLTSYPKPSNGVRATFRMDSNIVTLGDIKVALSSLFRNSTMAYVLRQANQADGEEQNIRG